MSDPIKRNLDREWHRFLTALNRCYEDAYRDAKEACRCIEPYDAMELVGVEWTDGEHLHVRLGASGSKRITEVRDAHDA